MNGGLWVNIYSGLDVMAGLVDAIRPSLLRCKME